jgi:hypothetical protein
VLSLVVVFVNGFEGNLYLFVRILDVNERSWRLSVVVVVRESYTKEGEPMASLDFKRQFM